MVILNKNIENTETDYVYFPDSEQLLENGCYYFKLSFSPDFELPKEFSYNKRIQSLKNDFTQDVEELTNEINDLFAKWSKDTTKTEEIKFSELSNLIGKRGIFNGVKDFLTNKLKGLYGYFLGDLAVSKSMQIRSILINSIASIAASQMVNDVEFNAVLQSESQAMNFSISLYKDQNLNTMNVFLPFNSMSIKRESGISSSDNIMGSMYKNMILNKYNKNMSESKLESTLLAQGYSNNKYKGFVLSNIPFETYSVEWDLMPHNRDEMMNILTILTYFQCCCLSSINLNDGDNMKMVLPPKCEMGIITAKHFTSLDEREQKEREEQVRNRLTDYSFNYVTSYNVNKENNGKNPRFSSSDSNKDVNRSKSIHWLKPPVPVYISSVDFEPLSNSGGVLLSPEGYPMGIKLKVSLCRTEMTTLDDIFINDNKDSKEYRKNHKKANPFA